MYPKFKCWNPLLESDSFRKLDFFLEIKSVGSKSRIVIFEETSRELPYSSLPCEITPTRSLSEAGGPAPDIESSKALILNFAISIM